MILSLIWTCRKNALLLFMGMGMGMARIGMGMGMSMGMDMDMDMGIPLKASTVGCVSKEEPGELTFSPKEHAARYGALWSRCLSTHSPFWTFHPGPCPFISQ